MKNVPELGEEEAVEGCPLFPLPLNLMFLTLFKLHEGEKVYVSRFAFLFELFSEEPESDDSDRPESSSISFDNYQYFQ